MLCEFKTASLTRFVTGNYYLTGGNASLFAYISPLICFAKLSPLWGINSYITQFRVANITLLLYKCFKFFHYIFRLIYNLIYRVGNPFSSSYWVRPFEWLNVLGCHLSRKAVWKIAFKPCQKWPKLGLLMCLQIWNYKWLICLVKRLLLWGNQQSGCKNPVD